ncbi:hypothetical protein EG68_02058 [Paragonimus skrjabini miyazakii]|uniref:Uncharacterized protein n=1 Tax=Paragonimus skrjabini miyazakii TaxID=59628 RepID=A0A8S9YZS9_9TREM|nr:hypothetical protein EG68_02058 [Paragonimus skrjabini miyazakii]
MNLGNSNSPDNDSQRIGFEALVEQLRNGRRITEQQSTPDKEQFTEELPESREGSQEIVPQRIGSAKCAVPMQAWMMEMEEEESVHVGRTKKSISSSTQAQESTSDRVGRPARVIGSGTGSESQRKVGLENALHAIEQLFDKEETTNYRQVQSKPNRNNNANGNAEPSNLFRTRNSPTVSEFQLKRRSSRTRCRSKSFDCVSHQCYIEVIF